jgi:serine/threonine protein kinase
MPTRPNLFVNTQPLGAGGGASAGVASGASGGGGSSQPFAGALASLQHSDFALLGELGRGSTSTVYRCRYRPSGMEYALKCIPVAGSESQRAAYLREVRALQVACSGMIACHGCFVHEDSVHIVLQLMEAGSLDALLRAHGPLPEPVACALAYQLLWCLARLRHAHLLHRDVKPSNVLLAPSGVVRLGDAGLAKETASLAQDHSFVGTVKFLAPERLQQGPYAYPADLYGAGLCLLQAVLGRDPLAGVGTSYVDILVAMLEAPALAIPPNGTPLPSGSTPTAAAAAAAAASSAAAATAATPATLQLSQAFRDMLGSALQRDPAARPTADALLLSPLFASHGVTDRAASEAVLRQHFGWKEVSSARKELELI